MKNHIKFLRKLLLPLIPACCAALLCGSASAADNFADAQDVGFGAWITESNQNATNEPSDPADLQSQTLWWKFTTTKRCIVKVQTQAARHAVAVYRGNSFDNLNLVEIVPDTYGANAASLTFPADAGMTFRVCIGNFSTFDSGNVKFAVTQLAWPYGTDSVLAPGESSDQNVANDRFEAAQPIPSNIKTATVIGYLGSATSQSPETIGKTGLPAVWYSWKAPYDGTLKISTPQSPNTLPFGHKVSVFTGTDSSALTSVASGTAREAIVSDDSVDLTLPIQAGKTYLISFGFFSYLDSFGETPFSYVIELQPKKINPDITVKTVNGKVLKDGSSKRDFGMAKVGKKSSQPFIIRNDGKGPLKIQSIRKAGKNPNDFVIVQVANPSLNTGMESSFQIRFKPTKSGSRSAIVRIISNDPDESPFDFTVTGTGMP